MIPQNTAKSLHIYIVRDAQIDKLYEFQIKSSNRGLSRIPAARMQGTVTSLKRLHENEWSVMSNGTETSSYAVINGSSFIRMEDSGRMVQST